MIPSPGEPTKKLVMPNGTHEQRPLPRSKKEDNKIREELLQLFEAYDIEDSRNNSESVQNSLAQHSSSAPEYK